MLQRIASRLLPFVVLFTLSTQLAAQDCNPPAITANAKTSNIFTPDQEMILGDLIYRRMSGDLRFLRNASLQAYVDQLGQKLTQHLPPTGLKFQFHIVDIPEANAFNIPGGYVFISRKLIGFANTEDELVGVIAHELGHAVVRHGAADFSLILKKLLNVTEVGDRKDIAEKYNLVMERQRLKSIGRSSDHESAQQLEADRIGLFAMVAAGYDPNAFASLFDRLVETNGKTGNWFTDIFGRVKPEQKRLREMIKVTEQLPAQCRENRSNVASNGFLTWQADVVSYNEARQAEQLSGLLWKKQLAPGLRTDVTHLSFSSDGTYLLAQDDFGITIIRRDPLQVEFMIPITGAQEAVFTPDGQFVVFGTESLRFEKWSIATRKPVEIRELVVRRDCWEHKFSPDGKYLACLDFALNLNVLDTQTGKKVFEKKQFYQLSVFELISWVGRISRNEIEADQPFFRIEYSPDSRFLTVSRSEFFRFTFKLDAMTLAQSENTLLALDLTALKTVGVGGDLKKVSKRPFVFISNDKILGIPGNNFQDAGVFSFPDGKRQSKFLFAARTLKRTANPNFLILKPVLNASMGIFDLSRGEIVTGLNKKDAAIWNNTLAFEGASGRIILTEISYNAEKKVLESASPKTLDLPASTLGDLDVAEVSDNFQWLGVSSKTRGALWNLNSGERKLHVRGFAGMLVANDGAAIGDFPKEAPVNHALAIIKPMFGTVEILREVPQYGAKQYGRFVLVRESLDRPSIDSQPPSSSSDKSERDLTAGKEGAPSLTHNVRMSLRDAITDKEVWSRDFPKEAPHFYFDKFSGRLIFYWTLGSNAGKSRLNEDPALAAKSKQMGNTEDDYLLEIIDAFATKTIGTLLLETGRGSFDILDAYSEGDWLVLHDSTNRVLSFSIKEGELQQRFFGANAAISPVSNQIAIENYPGELTLYNLASGDHQSRLLFSGRIRFLRFSLDGKRLFVLTDQLTAYAFEVEKIAPIDANTTAATTTP